MREQSASQGQVKRNPLLQQRDLERNILLYEFETF